MSARVADIIFLLSKGAVLVALIHTASVVDGPALWLAIFATLWITTTDRLDDEAPNEVRAKFGRKIVKDSKEGP